MVRLNGLSSTVRNPMLETFLRGNAFDITPSYNGSTVATASGVDNRATTARNLFQIEGFTRYQQGQISLQQANERGIYIASLPLATMVGAGTMIDIDEENQSTLQSQRPLINNGEMQRSLIGAGGNPRRIAQYASGTSFDNQVVRVDNRNGIDPNAMYMWELAPTHVIRDICDDYHGLIFKGSEVPDPLHYGCNCRVRRIDGQGRGQQNNPHQRQQAQSFGAAAGAFMGENNIWRNVQRFVDGVNLVNSQVDRVQSAMGEVEDSRDDIINMATTAATFLISPQRFLLDVAATAVVGQIKEQALNFARQKIEQEILTRTGYTQSQIQTMPNQMRGNAMESILNANPDLRQANMQFNALNNAYSSINNVNGVTSAIDAVHGMNEVMDAFNIQSDGLRRAINSPLLQQTKSRAVLIEGGVKGLSRLALLLF